MKRENSIFCFLSEQLQVLMKEIVLHQNLNENESYFEKEKYIEKMFTKGRERPTKDETKTFRKFKEFYCIFIIFRKVGISVHFIYVFN